MRKENLPTLEYYYSVEDVPDLGMNDLTKGIFSNAVDKAIQKISKENDGFRTTTQGKNFCIMSVSAVFSSAPNAWAHNSSVS